jgi:hypothetical protein
MILSSAILLELPDLFNVRNEKVVQCYNIVPVILVNKLINTCRDSMDLD